MPEHKYTTPLNDRKTILYEDLCLIACHECRQMFEHNDEIYTIVARKFYQNKMEFVTLNVPGFMVDLTREINFHKDCFLQIAGERYAP